MKVGDPKVGDSKVGAPCPSCGKPLKNVCPQCGKEASLYSRIVGYLRPISTWNPGKQEEFMERAEYDFAKRKVSEHQKSE